MSQDAIIRQAIQDVFAPVAEVELLKAKEYLTPAEVEKVYPLPASTLEKMRKASSGPKYIKRGRSVYYRPQDIRSYLDAHCQRTHEH